MTWRPKLVALDIDRTLVSPDERVSPAVRQAVRAAAAAGAHIVLATGRSTYGVEPVLDLLGLDDPPLLEVGDQIGRRARLIDQLVRGQPRALGGVDAGGIEAPPFRGLYSSSTRRPISSAASPSPNA